MDDKKKKFIIPEVEVVAFNNDDLITLSTQTVNDEAWVGDDNMEDWKA